MPVIEVGPVAIHLQEMNKGAPESVLMIHGMFSNLSIYYFNIAPILANDFHVVMYDMKSHGMSTRAHSGYDLRTMTDDLLALMDALQLPAVHLTGYSYGGLVALNMAMRFPERVKKLAVIEAPDPSDQETLETMNIYNKEFLLYYINNFADDSKKQMGKRQLEKHHRMYEFLFNETTIKTDMYNERHFFSNEALRLLPQETLLIYGRDSNCLPAGQALHGKLPRAQLVLAEGDHNVPVQSPNVIGHTLKTFFAQ